jgi:hypothetical protein
MRAAAAGALIFLKHKTRRATGVLIAPTGAIRKSP